MFASNGDFIEIDIQDTQIPFKDIDTKRMNFVKIIGVNKNFMKTILVIF
jgi:hypothetical protein